MRQLTSLDAQFLALENNRQTGHVGGLSIYDGKLSCADIKGLIRERLHLLPPFRYRLAEVPLGLDYPYWVEDPEFDLDYHVREIALPKPATPARPMTMAEKVLAAHVVGDGPKFVKPGDAVVVSVDGGYSHEFTTAQVHHFLEQEYGPDYRIQDPERFAVFEDHLVYATQDGFSTVVSQIGDARRTTNPGTVDYRWYPHLTRADLGIGTTGDYWVRQPVARSSVAGSPPGTYPVMKFSSLNPSVTLA